MRLVSNGPGHPHVERPRRSPPVLVVVRPSAAPSAGQRLTARLATPMVIGALLTLAAVAISR